MINTLPNGWYATGPFNIWENNNGCVMVGTEPGYVITFPDKSQKQFDTFDNAVEYQM